MDSSQPTPLMLEFLEIAKMGDEVAVVDYFKTGETDEKIQNLGKEALDLAIHAHQLMVVDFLLTEGVNPNSPTDGARLPSLFFASDFPVFQRLVQGGAHIHVEFPKQKNLLHYISQYRLLEFNHQTLSQPEVKNVALIIQELVKLGLPVNGVDEDGNTPLHLIIGELNVRVDFNRTILWRCLLNLGADPNLSNKEGKTALHFAAQNYDIQACNDLLKYGALNLRDHQGRTCSDLAKDRFLIHHANLIEREHPFNEQKHFQQKISKSREDEPKNPKQRL